MTEDGQKYVSSQDVDIKDGNENSQTKDQFDRDEEDDDGRDPKNQEVRQDGDDFTELVCDSEFKCGEKIEDGNPGSQYHDDVSSEHFCSSFFI